MHDNLSMARAGDSRTLHEEARPPCECYVLRDLQQLQESVPARADGGREKESTLSKCGPGRTHQTKAFPRCNSYVFRPLCSACNPSKKQPRGVASAICRFDPSGVTLMEDNHAVCGFVQCAQV